MHQRLIELAIQYISGDNGGLGYKPKRMISNRFAFVSAAMDYFTELSISDVRDLVREQLTKRKSAAALVLLFLFNIIVRYPFIVFYYCYLWIPVLIIRAIVQVIIKIINIVVKKSAKARKILLHIYATIDIVENAANKIMKTRFSELMTIFSQTLIEILRACLSSDSSSINVRTDTPLTIDELSELLQYEELEFIDELGDNGTQRRMSKIMHTMIPPNPFKATIRVRPSSSATSVLSMLTGDESTSLQPVESVMHGPEPDSPFSFPATPHSLARVMNRSAECVSSVMFAARDQLRLETLAISDDTVTRQWAHDSKSHGRAAAFDPRQAAEGLHLTCGNHCVFKIGKALCCSCKSMIHVRRGVYTYLEFSVTTSHKTNPCISIGLAPSGCPLNVMVGSWVNSVGLYSDGQVLVESKWYPNSFFNPTLSAGATVGILVYIPDTSTHSNNNSNNNSSSDIAGLEVGAGEELLPSSLVRFNINGSLIDSQFPSTFLEPYSQGKLVLFPTVSILSEGTRVWCRFSEADIVHSSRQSIGAPEGVRVYCLDGSLLLDEEET